MSETDFKEKEPKPKFKATGKSGTLVTGFEIQNDYISQLNGEEAQKIYSRMLLSDATIRKLYHSVSNPVRSAKWDIEPISDNELDLEVANLIKRILFEDMPDGWKSKLDEILTFPWRGHAVFEPINENKVDDEGNPYTGLKNLAFRNQETLTEWKFSPEGILEYIHQDQSGDIEVDVDIPAAGLIIFYNEKKGNDSGYPFCRMLYGNYKRKLLYKELQAIGIEKGAIGVPVLELPESVDYDSTEYAEAVDVLTNYTQNETAHIILPSGYKITLDQSNAFDPSKVQFAIKAENEEIAGSLVAMFLEMGIGGNSAVGSSTGESVEFFRDGIVYIADKISDKVNLSLIPWLVRLNYGDRVTKFPKLVHSGINDDAGKELMEVVTGYVNSGVMQADEPLEDHLRKVHNLPKKAEGEMLENETTQDEVNNNNPTPNGDDDSTENADNEEEVNLSTKGAPKTPRTLISAQAPRISDNIRTTLQTSSEKYIRDVMNRYKQLSDSRKQNATNKVVMSGKSNLRKDLRASLFDTVNKSIDMARKEVPTDVELNSYPADMLRMTAKYGDISSIKLNDNSKLPTHIQVLVNKQADLISEDSLNDLKKRLDFSYSSIETKSNSEDIIRQSMEDEAQDFIESNQVNVKGTNAAALMVNEGRNTYFFEPEVLDEIHSFTFTNFDPKSAICKELAGTTFATNDAESLRYSPPLHHNCKSYLRANLKSSAGSDRLEVSVLAPSAEAQKSITL